MPLITTSHDRILTLNAAAKRLHVPERTLRYRASHGKIPGAFKQGKLWKFALSALAGAPRRSLVAAVLCLCLLAGLRAQLAEPASRHPAPDFSLPDAQSRDIRLSQFQGKVVIVNFWATWCHGCVQEIPWFMEFADRYARDGLTVVGIAMDDDGWKSVTPYTQEKKINYPIVLGNEALAQLYGGVDALPSTFLIDRQGRIAAAHTGVVDRSAFEHEIQALLDEKPAR